MANETMRIFFSLKIFTYPQYDCSKLEQEIKNNSPDSGYGGPVMGGM
ncbi:MAG: hypothetical protein ABFD25_05185 [Clostridiaceae bacterium]